MKSHGVHQYQRRGTIPVCMKLITCRQRGRLLISSFSCHMPPDFLHNLTTVFRQNIRLSAKSRGQCWSKVDTSFYPADYAKRPCHQPVFVCCFYLVPHGFLLTNLAMGKWMLGTGTQKHHIEGWLDKVFALPS